MIDRKDPKHGCILFGCILSTLYSATPSFDIPEQIVNEAAIFVIGILFAVNIRNSEQKYSPLGQTYDALANLSIGITLIVKNMISLVILWFKGVRPSSGDLKTEILPRRLEACEKTTSAALWIITSFYYPIMDSASPETRAKKATTLFFLIAGCLGIEFLHNSCISYRLCRFGGGPRCDDLCRGSGEWTICFSTFWTYVAHLRDRIAFLALWMVLLRHKGDELSSARKEIDTSEFLLLLTKIAAIWYSAVQVILFLAALYAACLNCFSSTPDKSRKRVLETLQVFALILTRLPAGVAMYLYLYLNDKTALYVSIGCVVVPAAIKVIVMVVVGLAKLCPAIEKCCGWGIHED